MSEISLFICILLGFPVIFTLIWCSVISIVSFIGGWKRLADDYATEDPGNVDWIGWQTARMGVMDYRSSLWIAVSEKGLYLKTGPAFFFRFMHPPLLIPWKDIKELKESNMLFLTFAGMKVNGVSVLLPLSFLETLKSKTQLYS